MNKAEQDWFEHCCKPGNYDYMIGKELLYKKYVAPSSSWSHDHCEFCWARFSESLEDDLHEGYTTEDYYYWVCKECFRLFSIVFRWKIKTD